MAGCGSPQLFPAMRSGLGCVHFSALIRRPRPRPRHPPPPLSFVHEGRPILKCLILAVAAGLLIAILTLVPYNYFSNRAERELEEIEYYGSRLELLLAEQEGKN